MQLQRQLSEDQIRREAHEWRDRIANRSPSELEAKAFHAWLTADVRHERAYDRAITVWSAVEQLQADDIEPDLMMPSTIERDLGVRTRAGTWLSGGTRYAAAALSLMLLTTAALWLTGVLETESPGALQQLPQTYGYSTSTGEIKAITLPDGTRATLDAATSMHYVDKPKTREVLLDNGAVFLEVRPDTARPLVVKADDLVTTVVGTAFEVRSRGGVSRVAVSEGEVAVSYPVSIGGRPTGQTERVSLTAGFKITAKDSVGLSDTQPIAVSNVGAWRDERLLYDGATLEEVLSDLQRYSTLELVIDPALDVSSFGKVSASFNSLEIDAMTETLPYLFPVSIDRETEGQIVIRPAE
ncbi:MAG: FecR domain-containing protein [Pseudomonadota bacterium]